MTKIVNNNKIIQISKTRDAYIIWLKNSESVRLDKSKKLDYAFDYGNWNVFEQLIKELKK